MTSRHRLASFVGIALLLAMVSACGGGGDGADGAAVSALPAQAQVTVTPETAATPFTLAAGRYKFGWTAPECKGVDFAMNGQGQGFNYAKKSALPKFSAIVSDVPDDAYLLTQADPACTTWSVQIDRLGGYPRARQAGGAVGGIGGLTRGRAARPVSRRRRRVSARPMAAETSLSIDVISSAKWQADWWPGPTSRNDRLLGGAAFGVPESLAEPAAGVEPATGRRRRG